MKRHLHPIAPLLKMQGGMLLSWRDEWKIQLKIQSNDNTKYQSAVIFVTKEKIVTALKRRLLLHLVHNILNPAPGRSQWKCRMYVVFTMKSVALASWISHSIGMRRLTHTTMQWGKAIVFKKSFCWYVDKTRTLVSRIQWLKMFQISHNILNHFWGQFIHFTSNSSICSIDTRNGFLAIDKSFQSSSRK